MTKLDPVQYMEPVQFSVSQFIKADHKMYRSIKEILQIIYYLLSATNIITS